MSCCNSNCNHDPCGSSFNQSLTRAAQYAQYSQTQANKAEDLWLEFNALYLGSFAEAPTADNEGNPLQNGALYWNLGSNTMFVWNGSVWVENGNFDEFTNFMLPSATPVPAANLVTGQEYEIAVLGTTNWTAIGASSATVGVRFTKNAVIATGTGTARITRDLVTRFANVINVKDYGAIGDGIADDTAAIQAALDTISPFYSETNRATVYFPKGAYRITNTIRVKSSLTGLTCDSHASAGIVLDAPSSVGSAILVRSSVAGQALFAFSCQNLTISRGASSSYQVGMIMEACDNAHLTDVNISGFPTCLDIKGGKNCHYNSLKFSDFGSTDATTNVGLLQLGGSSWTTDPVSFTHLFTNSIFGGGYYTLKITSIDYKSFSNCYFANFKQGNVLISSGDIYGNYDSYFDNCYFDCNTTTDVSTKSAITITGTAEKQNTKLTDCRFSPWGFGVTIDTIFDPAIEITGCYFQNTNTPIFVTSASNATSLVVTGNQFRNSTFLTNDASCIKIDDAYQATICGNAFYWDIIGWNTYGSLLGTKNAISIGSSATIKNVSITGNVFTSFDFYPGLTFIDFSNAGTVDKIAISGNASNAPTNTLVGTQIGNQSSTNKKLLDWYEEDTFTPVLQFGGSSTGITYVSGGLRGNYTRIGNRVIYDIYVSMSSKGTSVGDVTVTGFPYPLSPSATTSASASVSISRIDGVGEANVDAYFISTTQIRFIYINSTGDQVVLNNTNFRNNSTFWISGTMQVE